MFVFGLSENQVRDRAPYSGLSFRIYYCSGSGQVEQYLHTSSGSRYLYPIHVFIFVFSFYRCDVKELHCDTFTVPVDLVYPGD